MKLLFDQNLSFKLCGRLADLFPGSNQVRQLQLDEADGRAIWQFAKANGFTMVSLDSDFADMPRCMARRPKLSGCGAATSPTMPLRNYFAARQKPSLHLCRMPKPPVGKFTDFHAQAWLKISPGFPPAAAQVV